MLQETTHSDTKSWSKAVKKTIRTCKELISWWDNLPVTERGQIILNDITVFDNVCWCKTIIQDVELADLEIDVEVDDLD